MSLRRFRYSEESPYGPQDDNMEWLNKFAEKQIEAIKPPENWMPEDTPSPSPSAATLQSPPVQQVQTEDNTDLFSNSEAIDRIIGYISELIASGNINNLTDILSYFDLRIIDGGSLSNIFNRKAAQSEDPFYEFESVFNSLSEKDIIILKNKILELLKQKGLIAQPYTNEDVESARQKAAPSKATSDLASNFIARAREVADAYNAIISAMEDFPDNVKKAIGFDKLGKFFADEAYAKNLDAIKNLTASANERDSIIKEAAWGRETLSRIWAPVGDYLRTKAPQWFGLNEGAKGRLVSILEESIVKLLKNNDEVLGIINSGAFDLNKNLINYKNYFLRKHTGLRQNLLDFNNKFNSSEVVRSIPKEEIDLDAMFGPASKEQKTSVPESPVAPPAPAGGETSNTTQTGATPAVSPTDVYTGVPLGPEDQKKMNDIKTNLKNTFKERFKIIDTETGKEAKNKSQWLKVG